MKKSKPYVIFKGGYEPHPRKRGPGIRHTPGPQSESALATHAQRAETFRRSAPDAPKHGSWGR